MHTTKIDFRYTDLPFVLFHQPTEQSQPSTWASCISYLFTPPKLLEWLQKPFFTNTTDKVEKLSEKLNEWILWNDGGQNDENIYRERQTMLNCSNMLDYFLSCNPIHSDVAELPHYFQRKLVKKFSFIKMTLYPAAQRLATPSEMPDPDEENKLRSVTCVMENGKAWITITDINNIVMFRLELLGFKILQQTKIKANVYSNLRKFKDKGKKLKHGSDFLTALTEADCIVMHRDQMVYPWASVEHSILLKKIIAYAYKHIHDTQDTIIVQALREPALDLMASNDMNTLNTKLQELIN